MEEGRRVVRTLPVRPRGAIGPEHVVVRDEMPVPELLHGLRVLAYGTRIRAALELGEDRTDAHEVEYRASRVSSRRGRRDAHPRSTSCSPTVGSSRSGQATEWCFRRARATARSSVPRAAHW